MIIKQNIASFNLMKYVIFSKEKSLQIGHITHVIFLVLKQELKIY